MISFVDELLLLCCNSMHSCVKGRTELHGKKIFFFPEGSDFILNRNHTLHPDSNTGNVFCLLVFQVCEDSVPENNETFTLTMTTTTSHVRLMHSNLTVNIIDNDGEVISNTYNYS